MIGAGVIFLGFGGSRWTAAYVERYIAYAVSVGMKILVLYLLIGAGMTVSRKVGDWSHKMLLRRSTQPELDLTWLPLR